MIDLRQARCVSLLAILALTMVGCDSAGKEKADRSSGVSKDTKKDLQKTADTTGSAKSSDSNEQVALKSTDGAKGAPEVSGKKVAKPIPPRKGRRTVVAKQPATAGQVDPAQLIMPKVLLSEAEAATCLVNVGDDMPEVELPDLEGQQQALSKLRGEKLTVVAFWTASHPYAVEELADLGPAVSDQFDDQGVAVVGINEQNTPAEAQQVVDRVGASFPILIDKEGAAWSKVASKKLPRTYLLDADGKILWFDMEYSRSTRRDLLRAIRFQLSER